MADLAATLGIPLDEWQESALEAAMGERSDGRWAAKFVGVSAPRQNGKSQLIVARALAGVLLFGEKTIIVSAHQTDTAREVFQRLLDVIEDNPSLEKRVSAVMKAVNREFVSFGEGLAKQTIKFKARVASGGRGFSSDCLLLDEAQILGKRQWGSIVPTMSARPNPQLWLFGTPPTEDDDAFAFSRVRDSAMKNKPRHCWLEWSAERGDDYDSAETWAKANPSYGVRISHEACADDRAAMDDEQFAMERLGMWLDVASGTVFRPGAWEAGKRSQRECAVGALAIAVTIDQRCASILAAGKSGSQVVVKPLQHGLDTNWVVDRAFELQRKHRAVVLVDGRGPAASLIPHLEARGVRVHQCSTPEVLDAFDATVALVERGELEHDDYAELNKAVTGAVPRNVGDRTAWGRRSSAVDISPLEAMSMAAWWVSKPSDPAPPPPQPRAVAATAAQHPMRTQGF